MNRHPLYIAFLISIFIVSCSQQDEEILSKELLFSLDYGKMEDQIDLFQEPGVPFTKKTRLYMRDGIFYISNGNSNKVMEFTSYGDILSLYYNEDENPSTFLLRGEQEEGKISNRKAYAYPFRELGEVAVNSKKELLVEDVLGERQSEFDEKIGAMLNRVVLRFDKEGKFLDYLGQEGVGGTPFPFIHEIHLTRNDEIVVVTRSIRHWLVFWFSPQGALLYRITLSVEDLPVPEGEQLVPSLSEVSIDTDERIVYLKIEYYGSRNENGEVQLEKSQGSLLRDIHYHSSYIWFYDIAEERFTGNVELPKKEMSKKVSEFEDTKDIRRIYDYIGNAERNTFFLAAPHGSNTFEILLYRRNGTVIARRYIEIVEKDIHYRDLYVTPTGVLTAFLAKEEQVEIVWWRTDKFLEDKDEDSAALSDG